MTFFEKFGEKAGKFYAAKYSSKGFCFALRIISVISGVLDYIGGSSEIANIIKTGNMAGIFGFMALIIAVIYQILKNTF